jgi:hypothetical protein
MAARVNTAPTLTYPGSAEALGRTSATVTTSVAGQRWLGFTRPQEILLNILFRSEAEPVFAVLDGSRDSRIPAFLDASGEPYTVLDPLGRAPAFIVALRSQARLLDVLIKDGWGRNWGFYCTGGANLDEVCAHWRNFLTLFTQTGRPVIFRFWDPRVLRALLPAMSPVEATDFFGPLGRIIVEGEKPEVALEISPSQRGPQQHSVVLV